MSLQIVHLLEQTPDVLTKSVFLAGPLARKDRQPDWRAQAINTLEEKGYDGTVFVPIPRDGRWPENYLDQVAWEQKHLGIADVVVIWCPRDPQHLPGFTPNVEFGELLSSGRLVYGRPEGAPQTRYLDVRYRAVNQGQTAPFDEPCGTLRQLAHQCVTRIGAGAERRDGERFVPLGVWQTRQFQAWYRELVKAGNRLDDVEVLWTFHIPQVNNLLFCYALKVKVWITAENRHKENEFILSRTDISSICAYSLDAKTHNVLDTMVVLIKEFRSPARTDDGFLHDLPGGSSFHAAPEDARQVAAEELESETGLNLQPSRFRYVTARQMAGTFGTHKAHLFAVELSADEIAQAVDLEQRNATFGVSPETEKTYVEVRTIRRILSERLLDHATIGMVVQACLKPWVDSE